MKSVLTPDQLSKLKFINNQVYVVPKKHKAHLYHSISEESMDRMASLLKGRDAVSSISKGKKAYILPDSFLSVEGWKVRLKENGYLVTSSPRNADFIVGSDIRYDGDYVKEFYMGSVKGEVLSDPDDDILTDVKNYTAIQNIEASNFFFYQHELINKASHIYYECESYKKQHLVKDSIMEVVYWILAKKLPVVDPEELHDSFDKLVIDADVYDTVTSMLSSTKEDQQIAINLLYNCDYVKSAYYIRKISKYYTGSISGLLDHTRLSVKFTEYYNRLRNLDTEEYLTYLAQNDLLSIDIYTEFMAEELKDAVQYSNHSELVKAVFEPTYSYEEFLELSKDKDVFEI